MAISHETTELPKHQEKRRNSLMMHYKGNGKTKGNIEYENNNEPDHVNERLPFSYLLLA